MKKSKYNIVVQKSNGTLIYNSFANNYVALSNQVFNALKKNNLNIFKSEYPAHYKILCENGMIIPDQKDELAIIRYKNKIATFSSRDLKVVIYPTQDCNLKCWYCYESHIPNTRMNQITANKIVRYVKKSIENNSFDDMFITIFGGEPFTNFEEVTYPLLMRIKETVEDVGKSFSCFFVTNASLINEGIISKLKFIKPHLQITLDGDKEHHDKIRIWKDGDKPTYDHILWVIHQLTKEIDGENFFITLRINYDNSTLNGAYEILKNIKDIDRKKIFVHFERIWQTDGETTEHEKGCLMRVLKEFIKEGFCVNQGSFRGYPYSCPSDINNSIIINYDGTIHKCNGRTLSLCTKYGKLNDDGSLDLDEDMMAKRLAVSTFENKKCLSCKMLPVCMGPCSQKMLEHNGKWAKEICSLGSIDTSLSDYLITDFWVKSLVEKYHGGK